MRAAACAILLLLPLAPAFSQTNSSLQARAIATGKRVSAKTLDPKLPAKRFSDWLTQILPKETKLEWESNDCGEQTGDPATTPVDPPVCAQVTAHLAAGRTATVMIAVGSVKKGISGRPAVFFISLENAGKSEDVKSLHELPDKL